MANPIQDTLVALVDAGVHFVVCGGVACIYQGVVRATHDLDLRVALVDEDLRGLVGVAQRLGMRPRIPEPLEALLDADRRRDWVHNKRALVYTLLTPDGSFSVDVFLDYPIPFEDLWSHANIIQVQGRAVRVSCKEHLLDAKLAIAAPRKHDLRDIEDLRELIDEDDTTS
jgi:hypothetical protein